MKITNGIYYLISNPSHIKYLTGFSGSESRNHEAYLLIGRYQQYFFTNSLYINEISRITLNKNLSKITDKLSLKSYLISRKNPLPDVINNISSDICIKKMFYDPTTLFVSELIDLKKTLKKITITEDKDFVWNMRSIKDSSEIAFIKKASQITDTAISYIQKRIKLGITEEKLEYFLIKYFHNHDVMPAFRPIVAFGDNSASPHHKNSQRKLKINENILIDTGTSYEGYCSDITRNIFFGTPSLKYLKAYSILKKTQTAILDKISKAVLYPRKIRIDGSSLDRWAKSVIKKSGFPAYTHSLGHNLGLDIHEPPRLTIHRRSYLIPGMVFTIEPGIYIPNEFGIRIEDTVCLSNSGLEILTGIPKDLIIVK